MWFLIGVLILISFILILIFVIKIKIKKLLRSTGLDGVDILNIVNEVKNESANTPKSLASMDRIYLKKLNTDFPDLNIKELKKNAEVVIHEVIKAFETGDNSLIESKQIFVDDLIRTYGSVVVRGLKIHNTVLSKYEKNDYIATITLATSFEYMMGEEKIQDRVKIEYIYVIDEKKLPKDLKVIGLHCPNCGAPLSLISNKKNCSYCGSEALNIISRVFTFNSIVRY